MSASAPACRGRGFLQTICWTAASNRETEGEDIAAYTQCAAALHAHCGLLPVSAKPFCLSVGDVRRVPETQVLFARGRCRPLWGCRRGYDPDPFAGTPRRRCCWDIGIEQEKPSQRRNLWGEVGHALQDAFIEDSQDQMDDSWPGRTAGHHGAGGDGRFGGLPCLSSEVKDCFGRQEIPDLLRVREGDYGEPGPGAGAFAPIGGGTCGRRSLSKALVTATRCGERTGVSPAADALWARRWTIPRRGEEGDMADSLIAGGTRGRRPLGKALVPTVARNEGTGVVPAADAHWARRWTTPRQADGK